MKVLFLINIVYLICILATYSTANYISPNDIFDLKVDQPARLQLDIYEQKIFKINQKELAINEKYEVKISYRGEVGVTFKILWIEGNNTLIYSKSNPSFRPLDTERLYFRTNATGHIIDIPESSTIIIDDILYYKVLVFVYRNTIARSKEIFESPIEVYIHVQPVVIPGLATVNIIYYAVSILLVSGFLCILLPRLIKIYPNIYEVLFSERFDEQKANQKNNQKYVSRSCILDYYKHLILVYLFAISSLLSIFFELDVFCTI